MTFANGVVQVTADYYNQNVDQFVASTVDVEMNQLLRWFVDHIPDGGHVLDWGCGCGRDSKSLIEAGYVVEATDASQAMCDAASKLTGLVVQNERFDDLLTKNAFDGIWANASLLHVPMEELPHILEIAVRALKPGGILYASFKLGDFEGFRNERWFTFMNEERLQLLLRHVPQLELMETKTTKDLRKGRESEVWFNCLLRQCGTEKENEL